MVEAAAPGTKRTYLRFADGAWSGCNLFLLATPACGRARSTCGSRSRRIASGRGGSCGGWEWDVAALRRGAADAGRCGGALGARAGLTAAAVASPFGLAAVDVDKPADLELVRGIVGDTDPPRHGEVAATG